MPIYKNNGVTYNIPDDKAAGFEAKFPGAMVALENEGVKYELPVSKKKGFMEKYSGATYSVAAPPAPKAEDINPTSDKSGYTLTAAELGLPTFRSESTSVEKLPEIESPEAPITLDEIRRSMQPSWRTDEVTEEPKVEVDAMTGESVKSSPQRLRITEEVGTYYQPNVGTDSVDETMNVSTKGLWRHTKNRMDASDKAQAAKEKYGEHSLEYLEAQEKLALATLQEAEAKDPKGAMAHIAQAEREMLREEKSRIERALDALNKQAAKRRNEITTNAGAFVYGMAPVTGNQMAEITDSEMTKITAAISNNEEALLNIDRQLRGEKPGFWIGVLDATLRNPDFYTMNLSGLQNTRAELSVGVNGIKDDLDREVAKSMVTRDEHAVNNGFWYDAGHMGGTAIPFVVSMALNPAQGTIRGGSKVAAGVARKTAANSIKRRVIKAVGTTADDLAEAAVIASSTGAPKTIENIGKRMTGQAVRTETGDIKFVNQEALPSAIYKGALESIFAFYTEKAGVHVDKWVGKKGTKLLESMGASNVSKALLYIKESDFVKTSNQVLRNMGVNDVGSEILEEELNILLNGTFIDPEAFKGLIDPEVQVDIIGGMCLTIGLTRAIPGTVASVGYIKQSRRLKRAEDVASSAFGAKWEKIKSDVENATNEEIAKVVNGYISDDQIANIALRDYYAETMKMRGYNIGTTKRKYNIPSAERSYQEGYEAADEQKGVVKQAYDMERERVLNTFGEEVVQRLDDDPIGALMELNEIDRQEAIGYVNAKTAYEGMIDHISDDIDERIKASDKEIESHANRQDGAIHPAMMRGDNGAAPKRVYIVNGNVATFEDGTIDKANSSSMIIVRDAETGEVAAASADDLESLDAVIDTEAEKKSVAEQIANEYAGQQAAIIEGESGKLTYNSNDGVHTVEILGENGDVFTILDNGVERIATREWVDELKAQNGVAVESGVQPEVAPVVEDQIGANTGMVVESSPTGEAAVPVVEAPKTAHEQIPRNEKNVPLYEQVDSELAWDGIVEEAGGNEETAMVAVNSMIADKKAALKKAEKAKARAGATITEKIAAENERVANIEKAKADLAKWQEIAGVKAKRAAAQAENVAQPVAETASVEEVETPQATNEMQEADLTEDVKTEDVNQSENNLEMVAEGEKVVPAYRQAIADAGIIETDMSPNGKIANTTRPATESDPNAESEELSHVQAEIVRRKVRGVFERGGSRQELHDAVYSAAHHTNANVTALSYLYKILDAVKAGKVSVEHAMDFLEENMYVDDNVHKEWVEKKNSSGESVNDTTLSQPSDQVGDQVAENGVRLSDEVDENGRQFVLNSNGDIVFGEIAEDSGLTPAPILLSEGLITNPATNDGYGLVHIEARHGDQIRKAGYNSVVEFVEEVAKNYEVIREGKDRDGHQTYMLQLTDKHNNTLMVELSGDGTYWNINTAGIFKTSYGKNRKEVYNRHTTAKQPTETVEASQDAEQSGTQATSSMNAPTTSSEGEGTTQSAKVQENTQKSGETAENGGESAVPEWLNKVPDDGRNFFVYVKFAGENKYQAIDLGKGETVDRLVRATMLQKEQLQALVDKLPSVLLEDAEFQIRDAKGNIYYNSGKVAAGNEVAKQEKTTEDDVLYRSSEEAVQTAEEFNRVHKGAAPTIIIDSIETLEDQLRNAEFSEEDIEFSKSNFYNELAYYHPTYDVIVINKHDVSKEELIGYLWHENAHNAIGKIFTSEETERMFNIIYGPEAPKVKAALAKAGYKPHQQAEEGIVMGIEKCFLDKDVLKRIKDGRMKPKEDVDEDAIFAIDYINKTVRFINNGTEQENGNDRAGRDKNNAGEGAPAVGGGQTVEMRDSKEEGESTSTTGGLTESEIALLEASTGYTREEIIDMFGYDLNREGNGPLTDREVVMESDPYSKVLGKPRYYGKRQREFVARQRRRMAEKARQVAEKLNLNNVEVLESTEGLTGKKATSKGWFDPKTGKITVVVPNHGSTGDIVETVLHEAVAHYGLRKLFGENFKNFLDNVYRNVTPEIRAEINELAKKHGWDFHTATEEYLASLAENTNFERVNPSLWSNIKSFFMKMLAKVGITLDEPLGDNELRYILWRSHQNLVNPGWFNVFGQAEDIAKQYELGVGNYASGEVKTESGEVAAEDEIRFRKGQEDETMQQQYDRRVNGEANAWKEGWLDATRSVRVAQEAIEKELDVTIDDMSNVFDYMNTIPSINKNKMEVFEGKHQNPFLQLLSKVIGQTTQNGVVLDEKALERYTNAKHGLERGREIAVKRALTTRENGKTVFNSVAYEDWREKRRAILANGKSWKEQQAELDALAQSYGAVLTDAAGLTAIFDPDNKMNYAQIVNEAMKFIEDVEGALQGNNALTPFWEAIKGINEYTLHEYFVGGLISRKQYDDLQDMYEYYVPLRGFSEITADERYDYVSERKSVLNSAVKNAYGRQSEAATIFATMLNMANSAIVYSSKNKVKQRLLNLAMRYQTPLLSVDNAWYVQQGNDWVPKYPDIREGMSEAEIQAAYQNYEAEMKELEAAGQAMKYKEGLNINYKLAEQWQKSQHAVSVMRNGREYIVYVNGSPKLAQAINGLLLEESHGWLLNASDKINHMRAKLVTGWSPSFVARNLARDTQGSSVYYFAKYGFRQMRAFQKNIRKMLPKIHGLYGKYKNGTLDMENETHRYFKEFLENGGETGYTEMISIKDYEKKIKKMLKENSVLSMAEGLPGKVADVVEFANRGVENTCRFAAYVTSREAGVSVLQSIKDAKEVSVNFNRKGSGAKGNSEARKLYMFLNPAIQAAVQRIELWKKYPARTTAVFATEFAMGVFGPMLFSLLYGLLGGDDDEAMGNYYNLTNFMRRSNLCLPLGDGVVTIPIAHESRVFYSLGEMLTSHINGHTEYDNIGLDLVNTFAQVLPLNPVEGWAPGESVEAILANFAPGPVKPLVEIYVNSNFAGAKIHDATDFTEHLPSQYRGLRNTGIFYQKASSMISGEYEKNWADEALGSFITPSSLEHLAQSYLGGLYTFVDETVKTAQWIGGSEEYADFRNVPILNSFYKSLEKYESEPGERTRMDWEKAFQHYYDAVKADADSEKTMNTRVKAKDAGAEVALTEAMERGDLLRIDIFNDGYDVIKDLYTEMDAAKQAKNFALVDKLDKKVYAQKKFIVERMEQLADDPLSGYDMLTMKEDTPYGRLETYADVRDAKVISDFKSDLKDIYDGYDTAENRAAYEKRYGAEMDLYEELYDITRNIGEYKSYEDFNEEDMLFIRQERAAAIGLIDEYLKSAAKVNL